MRGGIEENNEKKRFCIFWDFDEKGDFYVFFIVFFTSLMFIWSNINVKTLVLLKI
jgi:hypothetical protein